MCDVHPGMKRRHGLGMFPRFFGFSDCHCEYESKETRIKRLEAFKSHLEDKIKSLDEKIAELLTEEEGEKV